MIRNVRISPSLFKNYGKRLVNTPKLYSIDPAIVCAITGQPKDKSALSGAMGGAIFKGLIVSEASKVFSMKGKREDIFFSCSHDGLEVGLTLQIGAKPYPVEIKSTATPTLKPIDPSNKFKGLAGRKAAEIGLLVCRVEKESRLPSNNGAMPWHSFPNGYGRRSVGVKTDEKRRLVTSYRFEICPFSDSQSGFVGLDFVGRSALC